ncbi:MAG: hypothetical protein PHI29_04450 [Gallionella sp.]|nr:hypothetical protein [Gallionella sp.]
MFGLVVLIVMGLYLALLVWATKRGWRWGIEKKGWTGKKRWLGAAIGFLIVYLPVFWDWIPTVAVHQYYCAKESGFWVYKTLDQWKAENPRDMEGLVANKVLIQTVGDDENHTDTQVLNQRFRWVTEKKNLIPYLPFYQWKSQLIDTRNGEIAARWIDFTSGKGRDYLKFWLNIESCPNGIANRNNLFYFVDALVKTTDTSQRSAK